MPTEAVQTGQDGQFVFVVKADSTVEQRTVTTGAGRRRDDRDHQWSDAGETVVTEGQLRLEAGHARHARRPEDRRGGAGRGAAAAAAGAQAAPARADGRRDAGARARPAAGSRLGARRRESRP